jgi:biopolymer transport protein ExbD
LWNGQGVSRAELAGLLHEVAAMETPPELHLRPDAQARYEVVDEVLAIAKRQQVQLLGFVGNERYSQF